MWLKLISLFIIFILGELVLTIEISGTFLFQFKITSPKLYFQKLFELLEVRAMVNILLIYVITIYLTFCFI